ncbi:MAG: hypothetical protein B7Z66_07065 [Chromatiales bacterium 21-64-14]|nr:MAG: hypothetical protein B7Z66_07065 [Chromatiales bacterium 21-64-14]HQU16578.1 hypothetical protein [Gammaproteobacteria bacterium]
MYHRHRHRKPDIMLLLALFVGLGVVVTTSLQAHSPTRGVAPVAVSATHGGHTAVSPDRQG